MGAQKIGAYVVYLISEVSPSGHFREAFGHACAHTTVDHSEGCLQIVSEPLGQDFELLFRFRVLDLFRTFGGILRQGLCPGKQPQSLIKGIVSVSK